MYWTYCDAFLLPENQLQEAYERLTPSRKAHIDRLRQPDDKIRSLAGEVLVQNLLKAHCGIPSARLHRKENGQPYLTGCQLFVSISHSQRMVACAVSYQPVGIDIEYIRPINPSLLRHVCVEEEMRYVLDGEWEEQKGNDPAVMRRFFEIWTAKEAWFKKQGTGITNLKSLCVLPLEGQRQEIEGYLLQIL